MAVDLQDSEIKEPYTECALLSLLPQTLGASFNAKSAASEHQELDSIRSFFNHMALDGSAELMEQALEISKGSADIIDRYTMDGDNAVTVNGKDFPQGRRPALGRKRAQFSLKPSSSHSLTNIDLDSCIDHLEDPEEYFLAYEKLENANKELKKLRGEVATDLTQHHQSTTVRKRRPGILGKTASYQHHFPAYAEAAEAFVASHEENVDKKVYDTSKVVVDTDSTNVLHPEAICQSGTLQTRETNISELFDSTQREGSTDPFPKAFASPVVGMKKVNNLLDTLLSSFKDLDGDEGATLLRESLQIKSIDIGKIRLPELDSTQRNALRAMNDRLAGQKVEGSQLTHTSPTFTRSPFAAISTLQRRIPQIDPLKDLYSMPSSDDAPYAGHSSLSQGRDKYSLSPPIDIDQDASALIADDASSQVKRKRSTFEDKLQPQVPEADRTISSKIISEELLTDSPFSHDRNTDHNSSRFDSDNYAMSVGFDGCSEEGEDMLLEASVSKQRDPGVKELNDGGKEGLARPSCRDIGQNISRFDIDVDASSSRLGGSSKDKVHDMPQVQPVSQSAESIKETSSPAPTEIRRVDGHSEIRCILRDENYEAHQAATGTSLNRKTQQKGPPHRSNKQKSSTRRQSLADAGTLWKSGVRRSTRIKSRPLEYWRGERFLYGRIHDSLATVIGLKYASPGKELKVKSYVSEEYAELVAKAGLH